MHDGDYRNILGLDLVYNAEGKPLHETPPDRATREQTTSVRMSNDVGQRTFDLPYEVCTQAGCVAFVELGRRDQFALGQGVED
jgi:hypothetical protein